MLQIEQLQSQSITCFTSPSCSFFPLVASRADAGKHAAGNAPTDLERPPLHPRYTAAPPIG
jgi:hypothetical protein